MGLTYHVAWYREQRNRELQLYHGILTITPKSSKHTLPVTANTDFFASMFVSSSPLLRRSAAVGMRTPSRVAAIVPSPFLPELLRFDNGTKVETEDAWEARRAELWSSLEHELLGTMPTLRPTLAASSVLNETVDGQLQCTYVSLTYAVRAGGTQNISVVIELLSRQPKLAQSRVHGASKATEVNTPRPVFFTQWNHRPWAVVAATRGHVAAVIPTADVNDAAPSFQAAHRGSTFCLIAARAFVASLVLDYVLALPSIDTDRVHISGHSRNGKQSLIAAAFDQRFTAVVGSSPGAPIASPYRFTTSNFYGEGPRTGRPTSADWWLQSTLQYDGRPELMPVDGHAILGLIAPRRVLIATGRHDFESDMLFANEQALVAARPVYELLGAAHQLGMDNPRLLLRSGGHHGLDDVWGRSEARSHEPLPKWAWAADYMGTSRRVRRLELSLSWLWTGICQKFHASRGPTWPFLLRLAAGPLAQIVSTRLHEAHRLPHAPSPPLQVAGLFDFFSTAPAELLPAHNELLTAAGFRWAEWQEKTRPSEVDAPPLPPSAPLRERMRWLLDSSLEPSTSRGEFRHNQAFDRA